MDLHCRDARATDVGQLVEIARITFPLACPPSADPAAVAAHIQDELDAAHFRAWLSSPAHRLVVAHHTAHGHGTETGELLGYALLARGSQPSITAASTLDADHATPRVELSKIYVHPAAQGTGAADELMRFTLEQATDLSPGPVWLGTNAENARAQAFYRRHGFRAVGTRTYVVGGETHDDLVFVRDSSGLA